MFPDKMPYIIPDPEPFRPLMAFFGDGGPVGIPKTPLLMLPTTEEIQRELQSILTALEAERAAAFWMCHENNI